MGNGTGYKSTQWKPGMIAVAIASARSVGVQDVIRQDIEIQQRLYMLHQDSGIPMETLKERFTAYHQVRPDHPRHLVDQFCIVVKDRGIEVV